ncbi:MAG: T9SS type A sorting domain-containing protein [Bacteroidetes bacterium]|nr:T9SS type A sorting domain-containing protein [Bacteroidota bacterium]
MKAGYLSALFLLVFAVNQPIAFAQDQPIGYWRAHMAYNTAISVATDNKLVYVASEKAFFTLDIVSKETIGYSKVDGMAGVGMAYVAVDDKTGIAILGYADGNIDLFKDGSFYNIPDLKNKAVAGSKSINHIYTDNGLAYVSSDLGIIVINLSKYEVKETYYFTLNSQSLSITGLTVANNTIYACTPKGLYSASKSSPFLQAFNTWTKIDSTRNFISIASVSNKVFVTGSDSLFALENGQLKFVYKSDTCTRHIDAGEDCIWISENYKKTFDGKIKKMTPDYQITAQYPTEGFCKQIACSEGVRWIADENNGLRQQGGGGEPFYSPEPDGPSFYSCYDIYAKDKEVWVTHGGYNDLLASLGNPAGFSQLKNDKWTKYRTFKYKGFGDTLVDFTRILKDDYNGKLYVGSSQSGLFILNPDGSTENYKQNSFIDPTAMSPSWYRIGGLALDNKQNLWMTVYAGQHELVVKTKSGQWYRYTVPFVRSTFPNAADKLIIDDNGYKWYTTMGANSGVIIYDDNNTPENPNDDRYKQLLSGKGTGGLPDNETLSLAKDKNGSIWIGTKNGIGIVSCPAQAITGACEAEIRVVQYDQFAGYLFNGEQVNTIAVDGANRKWIGTNNGVWLVSAEGDKIINRFNAANSPLPSDLVQKIAIDPVTGDVYIGTQEGLVSYRGTATEGGEENKNVTAFPNPVPSGYKGTIAIKGVVENADVRITDISGQLVYRTKAYGGQAVWNGTDYTGHRPQSGVYLIFITNKDGSQTHVGKVVFME